MKNYNTRALRGEDYSDVEFQADMRGSGINIPDSVLFKPEMNDYVLSEVRKQNINEMSGGTNPKTQKPYTADEARREADELHSEAKRRVANLVKRSE